MLSVRFLGGLAVEWWDTPLPVFPGKIARSLFAYLLVHHDHANTRDLLAGTFWSEFPESTARRRLSQALWQIHHGLRAITPEAPFPLILAEEDTLRVNPDFPLQIDVDDFLHHLNQAASGGNNALSHDAAGVALYQGEFLEGYYDDWVVVRREQLRLQLLESLARLVDGYKRAGDYEHALTYARRLVMEEPWDEAGHREVMRLYHLLGREAEALKQFEQCRAFLTDELNAAPTLETVALAHEIAQHSDFEGVSDLPAAAPASFIFDSDQTPQLPLVGREAERAALLTHVEAGMQGLAGLVLVEGEAGVGKTRLLQTLAHDAEWRGVTVLWGAGREIERAISYAPFIEALSAGLTSLRVNQLTQLVAALWLQVLKPLLPPLTTLLPDLAAPPKLDPVQEQSRLAAAFAHLLDGWSQITPLVLILEDLHWASADTLSLLAQMLPRLKNRRLLIIGSYRSTEARAIPGVWEQLQALDRAGVVLRLTLSGLDVAATGELIRRSLGLTGTVPLFEARLYRETQGNPLFVLETLRTLHSEGLLTQDQSGGWATPWDDTTVDYTELPLPQAVEQTISRRLRLLSPAQRRLIHLAAIVGEHVDFDVLRAACESEPQTMLAAVRELVRYRFLDETLRDYRFSHDKVRQVAYADIDAPARLTLHRQVAQIIETLHPEQVVVLAHHWTQAEGWEQAADYYRQAGDQARAVYANTDAVAHYTQALAALAHLPDTAKQKYAVLLGREAVYDLMGKREAQAEDLATMAALAEGLDANQQGELALRQANHAEVTNNFSVAIATAQQAIRLGQIAQEAGLETSGQLLWGKALWRQGEFDAACAHFEQALALARYAALHSLEAKSLHALGAVCRTRGDSASARQYHEQALRTWCEIGDRRGEGMALNSLGIVCHDQGDYVAARQYYRQAAHISRQVGDRQHEGAALHNLGLIFRIERNFSEALTCYQQALDIAREIDARLFESYTLNSLGSILRAQGDYAEAKRYYEQSLHIKRELGDRPGQASALGNLGVVSRSLGDYVTAESHFVQSLCLFRDTGDRQGEAICLADLGLLHHCLGDDPAARESARQAVHLSQELGHRGNQAEALINLGRAELGLGHLAEATSAFRQAQTLLRELSRHYMEILPVAGLASVALAQGDLHQVGTHAEALWAYLQDHFPDGNYDPFWVYLTCYQGLEANGDPRAEAIVTTAYILLQERAAKIDDAMLRRSFLENVTANRELIAAYQAFQATPRERQITVHLPRADAPPGRSLRDDEYVTVTWTFTAPDDFTIQDRTARRRCRLLRLLSEAQTQGALPRDADLAEALDVSLATVRRDVAALRAAGHVLPARRRKHTA